VHIRDSKTAQRADLLFLQKIPPLHQPLVSYPFPSFQPRNKTVRLNLFIHLCTAILDGDPFPTNPGCFIFIYFYLLRPFLQHTALSIEPKDELVKHLVPSIKFTIRKKPDSLRGRSCWTQSLGIRRSFSCHTAGCLSIRCSASVAHHVWKKIHILKRRHRMNGLYTHTLFQDRSIHPPYSLRISHRLQPCFLHSSPFHTLPDQHQLFLLPGV